VYLYGKASNWFYRKSVPAGEYSYLDDLDYYAFCLLQDGDRDNETKVLACFRDRDTTKAKRVQGNIYYGLGDYRNAIRQFEAAESDGIFDVLLPLALLKNNQPQEAQASIDRILNGLPRFDERFFFLEIFFKLLISQATESQMLSALAQLKLESESFSHYYYLVAEYYRTIKNDPVAARKYLKTSLEYPFDFPSYYLSQKMLKELDGRLPSQANQN